MWTELELFLLLMEYLPLNNLCTFHLNTCGEILRQDWVHFNKLVFITDTNLVQGGTLRSKLWNFSKIPAPVPYILIYTYHCSCMPLVTSYEIHREKGEVKFWTQHHMENGAVWFYRVQTHSKLRISAVLKLLGRRILQFLIFSYCCVIKVV